MHWGRHYTLTHSVWLYDNGSGDQKTLRAASDVTIPACIVTQHFNGEQAVILVCVCVCLSACVCVWKFRRSWSWTWTLHTCAGQRSMLWSMQAAQSPSSDLIAPITAHGHHRNYWCISQGQPLSSCSRSHTHTHARTHRARSKLLQHAHSPPVTFPIKSSHHTAHHCSFSPLAASFCGGITLILKKKKITFFTLPLPHCWKFDLVFHQHLWRMPHYNEDS